jgi:hypothetical protein
VDLSLYKNFAIKERLRIQVRAESTNAFNHPTFSTGMNLNVDTATATTFLNPKAIEAAPRIIRLGVKIVF